MQHDYRYWTSDGVESDEQMFEVGRRDFGILTKGLDVTGKVALEVGCGPGRLLKAASEVFDLVYGIDCSEAALKRANTVLENSKNVKTVLTSGMSFPEVPANSVDFVYSFAAMFSMPVKAFASNLSEVARTLKPAGIARLQLYLGAEIIHSEEDTLGIRTYQTENFYNAVKALGFELVSDERLVLPFEISDEATNSIARIVTLKKVSKPSQEDVLALLTSEQEAVEGGSFTGSLTEYQMALSRANQHLASGNTAEAITALEFAVANYKEVTEDVLSLLEVLKFKQGVGEVFGSAELYEKNLRVLKDRFPKIATVIERATIGSEFSLVTASNGEKLLSIRDTLLDNGSRPSQAAQMWAERQRSSVRPDEFSKVVVVGFSAAYHIEELLNKGVSSLAVVEPNPAVIKAACGLRDLTKILTSIDALEIDSSVKFKEHRTLFIHPQTNQLEAKAVSEFRRSYFSAKGIDTLKPNIGVVGPVYGGTLPMFHSAVRTLNVMGQKVIPFDFSKFNSGFQSLDSYVSKPAGIRDSFVKMLSDVALARITENPVDVLICLAQAPLTPDALTEIRKRGIITALWFVEDCSRFASWQVLAKHFDYVFTIQKEPWLSAVEQAGAGKAVYMPSACDPTVHRPITLSEEDKQRFGSEISFVGAGYNNRQHVFAQFSHMDFKIWGTEWPGAVPFPRLVQEGARRMSVEEYVKVFNASKINLNLHSSTERDGVDPKGDFINPRTFELAACGAFQLVDRRSLLPELFTEEEIPQFSTVEELKSKIEYFRDKPEEREKYVRRARARVLAEHTYEQRIQQMLGYIYADHFESLQNKQQSDPWEDVLELAAEDPELRKFLEEARAEGCSPVIDDIVARKVRTGSGDLSEVEQKLLFIFNFASQIISVEAQRRGLKT